VNEIDVLKCFYGANRSGAFAEDFLLEQAFKHFIQSRHDAMICEHVAGGTHTPDGKLPVVVFSWPSLPHFSISVGFQIFFFFSGWNFSQK
jgi:hypothetical protein